MNSGGASNTSRRQTSITFTPTKSKDTHANPQDSAGTSNMNNNERSKCGRFEIELEDEHNNNTGTRLQVPMSHNIASSDSENSLVNSDQDSISTISRTIRTGQYIAKRE